MKNDSTRNFFAGLVTGAGFALLLALVLHDTATTQAALKQQAAQTMAQSTQPTSGTDAIAYITSAPYRDGLYQGKLARERGESGHVSAGRWGSQLDRSAYNSGYLEGFGSPVNEATPSVAK